ncbi:hypothetical protein BGZ94_009934 [Podila epigama]|nr:hypothetical protein BGZ94_009934 [Podila epigama]
MNFMAGYTKSAVGGPLDTSATSDLPPLPSLQLYSQPPYQQQQQQQQQQRPQPDQQEQQLGQQQSHRNSPVMTTVPPEIIRIIVNYLDKKELITVLTLNWTWANWAAPKLWEEVNFAANNNRIVFLITKSVAPPSPGDSHSSIQSSSIFSTSSGSSYAAQDSPPLTMVTPDHKVAATTSTLTIATTATTTLQPQPFMKRRNSYPWPTLLPYHSMIQKLNVSLSSADMIQDLIDIIPCCTELRRFSIRSAIPTEDLMIKGMIASAVTDCEDSLHETASLLRPSESATSLSSLASQSSVSAGSRCPRHSHVQSLALDPYNSGPGAMAGLHAEDDTTIMASSTSQSGLLLKLLASSCPKLEHISFSGFHPISVLGAPTDLKPRPQRFDLRSSQDEYATPVRGSTPRPPSLLPMTAVMPAMVPSPIVGNTTAELPPIAPCPGLNHAVATVGSYESTSSSFGPATTVGPPVQSRITSIQCVNCTIPPQYLLTMIQHALPNLTEINLLQCWQGNPLHSSFLQSLSKINPGLKAISLHATQSHRGMVTSEDVLRLLKSLEGRGGKNKGYSGGLSSLADFPLGTFSHSSYTTASSTAATHGSGGSGAGSSASSQSSSLSDMMPLPSIPSTPSSSSLLTNHLTDYPMQQQQNLGDDAYVVRNPSDLESFKVAFTHSILDAAIVHELSNRRRHPKLRVVEFGSDDAFDAGIDLLKKLQSLRPEISAQWIDYGDTGEDRED